MTDEPKTCPLGRACRCPTREEAIAAVEDFLDREYARYAREHPGPDDDVRLPEEKPRAERPPLAGRPPD
jgi:hypothetical protein